MRETRSINIALQWIAQIRSPHLVLCYPSLQQFQLPSVSPRPPTPPPFPPSISAPFPPPSASFPLKASPHPRHLSWVGPTKRQSKAPIITFFK